MQRQMLAASALVAMAANADTGVAKAGTKENPTLLAKLSIKTMGAKGAAVAAYPEGTKLPLCRFGGLASGIKVVTNPDTGDVTFGLKGVFRGVNFQTGEHFGSGVCYLPSGIGDAYIEAMQQALETDKAATLKVGVDVVGVHATNKAGYSFEANSFVPIQTADAMKEIMEAADKAGMPELPKLPAPAK